VSLTLRYVVWRWLAGVLISVGVTVGIILWTFTYMFRVANKDMTYAKQLKDYEDAVLRKRLEELQVRAVPITACAINHVMIMLWVCRRTRFRRCWRRWRRRARRRAFRGDRVVCTSTGFASNVEPASSLPCWSTTPA
jgi:hypothetical protein